LKNVKEIGEIVLLDKEIEQGTQRLTIAAK